MNTFLQTYKEFLPILHVGAVVCIQLIYSGSNTNTKCTVDVGFSFYFVTFLKLNLFQISQGTEKYFNKSQAFASFQHGFLRSEENVNLHNLREVVWENVYLHNFQHCVVRCCFELVLCNGIMTLGRWYAC